MIFLAIALLLCVLAFGTLAVHLPFLLFIVLLVLAVGALFGSRR